MKKTIVSFVRAYSPYQVGDVAGFSEDKAEALIRGGYATKQKSIDTDEARETMVEAEVGREMRTGGRLGPDSADSDPDEGGDAEESPKRASKADKPDKVGKGDKPPKRKARNRMIETD